LLLLSSCAARSVGVNSRFDQKVNSSAVNSITVNQIGSGFLDLFAQEVTVADNAIARS
jgi:hypothetical protein